uniref:WD_REPEATS_REGION domain-containing protein n=1 Tax=Angiostrongylus cantonensis TaxID=6313 RepID=A0A158P9P5_ANGCA
MVNTLFFSANKKVVLYDRRGAVIDALDIVGNVIGMAWDKEGDVLGIITNMSSLAILWNINTRTTEQLETAMGARKIPVLGKHQRRITDVTITKQDEILCCSDDNTITVSSPDGETLKSLVVSAEPNDLKVGEVKRSGGSMDIMVSAVLGKKTLFLSSLAEKPKENTGFDGDTDSSMNLQFQEKYGHIVAHAWYNDGYIVVGFAKGFVVCISAHLSEMGQEIFNVAEYKTYLAAVAACSPFGKILTVGDHQIKVREMRELNDIFAIVEVDKLSQIECSTDGQLVAVASSGDGVSVYITKMPSMGAAYGDTMAALSSLNQVTYWTEADKILNYDSHPSVTFPEPARNTRLLSASLSNNFFIFSTEANYLVFFSLSEWCVVSEYRHTSPIQQIHPDQDGLRNVVFDERADTWVYSPVDDSMHKVPAIGSAVHYKAALWETFTIDRDTFVVYDNSNLYVYLLNRSHIEGESVLYVGSTKLPFAHYPLMLSKGIVHCLTSSSKTSGVLLDSHRTDTVLEGKPPAVIHELLKQALQLKRSVLAKPHSRLKFLCPVGI